MYNHKGEWNIHDKSIKVTRRSWENFVETSGRFILCDYVGDSTQVCFVFQYNVVITNNCQIVVFWIIRWNFNYLHNV